ncbi:hypothetical protein MKEN_01247300 [Mycena kentingensis (nom. inval.)]|nr:hypothetical protein MKEN_01247300 [Mycena kentingensis (nom. inval.)]
MSENNDSICEGCSRTFPLRQGSGLCSKCKKLDDLAIDSPEHAAVKAYPQCEMCSLTFRHMQVVPGTKQVCNSEPCKRGPLTVGGGNQDRNGKEKDNLSDSELQAQRRAQLMQRMKKGGVVPGTTLTSDELLLHEHGGGAPGERQIIIGYQVRVVTKNGTTKIYESLGWAAKNWAVTQHLPDIQAYYLERLNDEWTKSHSVPIRIEEVSLRFYGGKSLAEGTENMTVDRFWAFYSQPSQRDNYFKGVGKPWSHQMKSPKPFLPLELLFNEQQYNNRISGPDLEPTSSLAMTKRARTPSSAGFAQSIPKKSRPSSGSSFAPPVSLFGSASSRTSILSIHKQTAITFQKIEAVVGSMDGVAKLVYTGDTYKGYIMDSAFSAGRMKQAHDVVISGGSQFVAKRFFRLDEKQSEVSVADNNAEVELELVRLAQLDWVLAAFNAFRNTHEDGQNVPFYPNLAVANAFIAQETGDPSKASGVTAEYTDERVQWIVEAKRAQTVIKFTGTLTHHQQKDDLRTSTVHALAHFAFGFTNRNLVFADLQGTPALVKGKDGLVLFDVMTHTDAGDSGVGDCGEQGIQSFVEQHKCNAVCVGLGLDKSYSLVAKARGDEDDDEEEEDQLEEES